jgi:general secretion pathway protein G
MAAGAKRADNGFSMIELLVVIVVLGVLATIVISAARGATDDAQQNSCIADVTVIDKAEQLFEIANNAYGTELELVDAGYLHSPSVLHDVAVIPAGYAVVATNTCAA